MIVVSFKTKRSQQEILTKAAEYFTNNIGLKEVERSDCCIRFEDDKQIGYVKIDLLQENHLFEVKIEGNEYEYYIKRFLVLFK